MINVIGLGYIGLPTSLMLQAGGNHVVGTDINTELIEKLNAGSVVFKEEGMNELYQQAVGSGIRFSDEYQCAEMYIIAVPTPYIKKNKRIDPQYVIKAVKRVLEVCPSGAIIVIESTVSPNTIDYFIRPLLGERKIYLAHAPERIIPGNMLYELHENSRVIGADEADVAEKVCAVYASFCKGQIVKTNIRTAEMSKVAENTFRDINIAYANELAIICNESGLDVYEVIKIANMHPRVNILQPGPGVGGHCISVDPWFLVGDYPEIVNVIRAARKVNDAMPDFVLIKIQKIMEKHNIKDLNRVGLYGLTYKENVDDIRESPTLQMITSMKKHLAYGVCVYDPYISKDIVENQYHNLDRFINQVDLIIIMVAHDEIIKQQKKLQNKIVFDTRNKLKIENIYHL